MCNRPSQGPLAHPCTPDPHPTTCSSTRHTPPTPRAPPTCSYEGKVKIGMDVAASEFLTEDKMYDLKFKVKDNDGSGKKTG